MRGLLKSLAGSTFDEPKGTSALVVNYGLFDFGSVLVKYRGFITMLEKESF